MKPHNNHSYSRLNVFSEQCERRYAYDALIPEDFRSLAIIRGNAVHLGLERMAKEIVSGHTPEEAAKMAGADPPEGLREGDFRSYLERAILVFEHLRPAHNAGGARTEEWFRMEDPPLVGKIDLVAKTTPVSNSSGGVLYDVPEPCVVDWKTTNNPARIPTEHQVQKSLQLQIYAIASGIPRAGYVYFMPTGAPVCRFALFTEKQLALTRRWLSEQLKVMDARWVEAKAKWLVEPRPSSSNEVKGYNLSVFSLAQLGHPLCTKKWCRHWARCFARGLDKPPK